MAKSKPSRGKIDLCQEYFIECLEQLQVLRENPGGDWNNYVRVRDEAKRLLAQCEQETSQGAPTELRASTRQETSPPKQPLEKD